MKYLAILRDSYREALDSKVLYVTFGLTALVLLFVGSTAIKPLTMKEELEQQAKVFSGLFSLKAMEHGAKVACRIEDFEQLNDAPEPWNGEYRFTFVVEFPPALAGVSQTWYVDTLLQALPATLWRFESVRTKKLTSTNPLEYRLQVHSKGSQVKRAEDWNHLPIFFFGAERAPLFMNSLTYMVYWVERWVVNLLVGWVIVLLSVIATAFFIPNMLRRGSVELLLSKPISRSRLLLFKYLGGLAFVFVNSAVLIGGVYVLVGLKTGIWAHGFLLTILLLTYFFAILYSISTLLAVLTQSTVVCILLSIKCWFLLLLVGWLHSPGEGSQGRSPAQKVVNGLHAVLPRPLELGKLTEQFLSKELLSDAERKARGLDEPLQTSWAEALGVSTAFIAVMLGLACWRFSAKDP